MNKLEALLMLSICAGAFIMPFLSRRLHFPSAVGEIFFGLCAGLFFKEIFQQTSIIEFLGELGFLMLMYLAGLEIDFEKIKVTPKKELFLYILVVMLVVAFSFAAMAYYRQPPVYALIYLTTAVGLLFPVLRETGIIENDTGQRLLIIGSIGEVVSLLSLTLFSLYYRFGFSMESVLHLGQLIVFTIGAYILYRTFRLLSWWFPGLVSPFFKTGDPLESGIRANFVNMFVFVALAALLDMELIVGAFLGGMAFALIFKEREKIQEKVGGIAYGFLIPVFFIEVGLRFDIKDFFDFPVLLMALAITVVIFFVRLLAAMALFFSRICLLDILLVPISTSFSLTLLVAIATFGLKNGIIAHDEAAAILLASILTAFIYPALMKIILKARSAVKT